MLLHEVGAVGGGEGGGHEGERAAAVRRCRESPPAPGNAPSRPRSRASRISSGAAGEPGRAEDKGHRLARPRSMASRTIASGRPAARQEHGPPQRRGHGPNELRVIDVRRRAPARRRTSASAASSSDGAIEGFDHHREARGLGRLEHPPPVLVGQLEPPRGPCRSRVAPHHEAAPPGTPGRAMASAPILNAASIMRRAVSTEPSCAEATWATTRQGWLAESPRAQGEGGLLHGPPTLPRAATRLRTCPGSEAAPPLST